MQRIIYYISAVVLCMVVTPACKKSQISTISGDGIAPGPIRDATVENLNGAAKITYKLPPDEDLLYIKAVYTTGQGLNRETKVSYYVDNLIVDGFGDTAVHEVKICAVDRGEKESPALSVSVKPKKAPFLIVRDSIKVVPDFGGINVAYVNAWEADIAIVVLTNDKLGNFAPVNTSYTNLKAGNFNVRDLPSVDTKFGIYVRDRWGNISDTMIVNLAPLFEIKLDRTIMKGVALPTDAPLGYSGNINFLFDGVTTGYNYYHSGDAARMPQWFTYDIGITAKLSRLAWFMRDGGNYYSLHNPRNVEIWGSNAPDPNGSFNNWVLLATYEQIKPSGLPNGQLTNADNEAAKLGETINFPVNAPAVRYIRFKTLRNWSEGTYVNFTEIMMWGATQ